MKKSFKRRHTYLLSVENVSRLERVATLRLTLPGIIGAAVAAFALLLGGGAALIMLTPLKRALPGYMKADERTATEEGLLRLDSLRQAAMRRDVYLAGIIRALDTSRPADTVPQLDSVAGAVSFDPDSLMQSTPRERKFVKAMQESKKYNLSILAPLAAERMEFMPPVPGGIFTAASRGSLRAEIAASPDAPVVAVAPGSVVAVYTEAYTGEGVVVIQHDNGFLTRYSGLELPALSQGDRVEAGHAVAYHAARRSDGSRRLFVEMWHDSDPVIPYRFVAGKDTPDGLTD